MDDAKALVVTVCTGLARLQLRLLAASYAPGPLHHKTIQNLKPASPWLDRANPTCALAGVIHHVALAQAHLLAMVDSPEPIDAYEALRALQHVQGDSPHWGAPTIRFAALLGYTLKESPLAEFHGQALSDMDKPVFRSARCVMQGSRSRGEES